MPTRRCVAPCATAASRSPLIPAETTAADGWSRAQPLGDLGQPGEGRRRVRARAAPPPSPRPGRGARPRRPRRRARLDVVRRGATRPSSSGSVAQVDLHERGDRPAGRRRCPVEGGRPGARGRRSARRRRTSPRSAALLRCSCPTKCQTQVAHPGPLALGDLRRRRPGRGSRRRRAPRGRRGGRRHLAGKVLVTATRVTLRPGPAGRRRRPRRSGPRRRRGSSAISARRAAWSGSSVRSAAVMPAARPRRRTDR